MILHTITSGDVMEKRMVYVAYLVIFLVVFNFFYGITDQIRRWQLWNWYLVILLLLMGALLFIKYKQHQQKNTLIHRIKEAGHYRCQLNQLLLFERFKQLSTQEFNLFLQKLFQLQGYETIEISENPQDLGYDLMMWRQGKKTMVKWFKNLSPSLKTDGTTLTLESENLVTLKEVREAYGVMNDYEIQADELILISTSDFEEEAADFISRNGLTKVTGEQLYYEVDQLTRGQMSDRRSIQFTR